MRTTTGQLRHAVVLVLGLGVAAALAGCPRPRMDWGVLSACAPAGGRIESVSRDEFVRWASRLPYARPDSTQAFVYGFASTDSVRIERVDSTIAARGAAKGCVIARLTSARAYPRSGIGVGRNYIWVDSLPAGHRSVIIPENPSVPITLHPLQLHSHLGGGTLPPRVGVLGYCDYCMKTLKVWCRGPMDSVGVSRIMELREFEVLFRPNRAF